MNHDGPYTFGVEEEFFLANARSAQIVKRASPAFQRDCRARLGVRVGTELLQSQVEVNSSICSSSGELDQQLRMMRSRLIETADQHSLALVAAGTFPTAEWNEQVHTDKPRYQKMVEDFQIIGRRNLLCGLHVHVAPPAGADRIDIMNRILPWLPLFLALSTSSPFWMRYRTGLLSYRQSAYDEWPRTGIPDYFHGEADYDAFVRTMVGAGIIDNASYLWWAIRPSARFPTLELRICDMCTRVEDAVGLASLYRCLVRLLVRNPDLGRARSSMTRLLIEENRWLAKRHGPRAEFVDIGNGHHRKTVSALLSELIALTAEDAEHFGCEQEVTGLGRILDQGSSAERQLAVYREARDGGASKAEAGRRVTQTLIEETRRI
jgi:glutamate---cysteine ligase / carboxylate-amine ligase